MSAPTQLDAWPWFRIGITLIASTLLLFSPVMLAPGDVQSINKGVMPFLLSPLVITLFLPLLTSSKHWMRTTTLLPALTFPLYIWFLFFVSSFLFHSPLPSASFQGGLFLYCFSLFLIGLSILVQGGGGRPFTSQWVTTTAGFLLLGSFVYLSPIVDMYYGDAVVRSRLIAVGTQLNPFLAMGGTILKQDLLRGSFLYEHLSIGRFYSYSAPNWVLLSFVYLITGGLVGGAGIGWFYHRHQSK